MHPLKLNNSIGEMIKIGSVANLGAEIVTGDPQAKAAFIQGNPETNLAVAYFSTTKGSFKVDYPFSEHATLVSGRVTLTNETTGVSETFEPGDSWFINKGDVVTFHVETEEFLKHYLSIVNA